MNTSSHPFPMPGFYYAHTRQPADPVNHHAFQVVGVTSFAGMAKPFVLCRILDEAAAAYVKNKQEFVHFGLSSFRNTFDELRGGESGRTPRFSLITDRDTLEQLIIHRVEMFPESVTQEEARWAAGAWLDQRYKQRIVDALRKNGHHQRRK